MIPSFRFKEFSVSDDKCGMKLSSDAVLLGAYVRPPASGRILDIGCGCGILSLMMAQQSLAQIAAVEINEAAANQARENFENSKWAERLKVFNMSVQKFANKNPHKYDCIISNPPYFHQQLKSADAAVKQSKHTDELSFAELCGCASKLLHEKGTFWVILPVSEKMNFLNEVLSNGLYCRRMLTIYDKVDKAAVRNIFCMSKEIIMEAEWEELVIKGINDEYTPKYKELTRNFYL